MAYLAQLGFTSVCFDYRGYCAPLTSPTVGSAAAEEDAKDMDTGTGPDRTHRRRWVQTPHALGSADALEDGSGERGGLANTALCFHAARLLALEEGSKPWQLRLPDLETVGRFTFDGGLRHNFTAHVPFCIF